MSFGETGIVAEDAVAAGIDIVVGAVSRNSLGLVRFVDWKLDNVKVQGVALASTGSGT